MSDKDTLEITNVKRAVCLLEALDVMISDSIGDGGITRIRRVALNFMSSEIKNLIKEINAGTLYKK